MHFLGINNMTSFSFTLGVAFIILGTTSSQAWGDRRHRFSSPHNQYGPPHNNYGPPSRGRPRYDHWYDSNESDESDSGNWSGPDSDSSNWHFPCHHDNDQRWPPKPKPTPRPNPNPNPGPFPKPNPKPGPTPGPNPYPNPNPNPKPGPNPNPNPNPEPFPQPRPNPNPNPGPFPQPRPSPNPNPGPFPQPSPGPLPRPSPSPREPELQACLRGCPVTSEYNPVCGTDGVTYTNPGRLECAKMCGVAVSLLRNSRCPANGVDTTVAPTRAVPDAQACILTCPVTSEYNPVCGSNGVTYSNMGRLECAKMCGVPVTLNRMSRCPAPQPTANPTPSSTEPFREPVPPTPTPTPTVGPVVTPGVDFTIDQDLLDEIFTTEGPDLSGLIDERHQDD